MYSTGMGTGCGPLILPTASSMLRMLFPEGAKGWRPVHAQAPQRHAAHVHFHVLPFLFGAPGRHVGVHKARTTTSTHSCVCAAHTHPPTAPPKKLEGTVRKEDAPAKALNPASAATHTLLNNPRLDTVGGRGAQGGRPAQAQARREGGTQGGGGEPEEGGAQAAQEPEEAGDPGEVSCRGDLYLIVAFLNRFVPIAAAEQ